jgi:hypothetical protein
MHLSLDDAALGRDRQGVLLEHEPFTSEHGLLTPSEKLNRRALLAHYGERLSALYDSLERHIEDVRGVLVDDVLPRTLGDIAGFDGEGESLINDSLSAVRLMQVLRDRCVWQCTLACAVNCVSNTSRGRDPDSTLTLEWRPSTAVA